MLKQQYGLSLIEIMVALVISVFLLGGIVQVYLGNKTTFRFTDANARIQENGRFAIDILARDTRLAGFFGCVDMRQNSQLVQNHLDTGSPNYDPNLHDFIGQRPLLIFANAGLNNSDDILIKGSKGGQSNLTASLALPGSGALQVEDRVTIEKGDMVLISNCWTTDIFEATNATKSGNEYTITHTTAAVTNKPGNDNINACPGNSHCLNGGMATNLDSAYEVGNTSVYVLQSVRYSIQASASGSGEPALWRSEGTDNQELIEGIERMIVLYGIDTDNDGAPNQYVDGTTALAATDIVTAVRIFLLVRSDEDNVMETNQQYTLNGQDITAPDRRLRQVFSVTVDLRNR